MKPYAAAALDMEIEAAAAAAPSVKGSSVIAVGGGECVEAGGESAVAGSVRWSVRWWWHVCGGGGHHDGKDRRETSTEQPSTDTRDIRTNVPLNLWYYEMSSF